MEDNPTLPPELHHLILTQYVLRPDLLNCAAVCQSWVPWSRTAFFSQPVEMVSSRVNWADINQRDYSLPWLIESPYSTLKTYLTRVSFEAPAAKLNKEAERQMKQHVEHWNRLCGYLMHNDFALVDITISWTKSRAFPPRVTTLIAHSLPTLLRLTLSALPRNEFNDALDLIASSSHLQHLDIAISRGDAFDLGMLAFRKPPASVRNLTVNFTDCVLLKWVEAFPNLADLSIAAGTLEEISGIPQITAACTHLRLSLSVKSYANSTLSHFRELALAPDVMSSLAGLHVSLPYGSKDDTEVLNLCHATNLTSLSVHLFNHKNSPPTESTAEDMLLSLPRTLSLASISLSFLFRADLARHPHYTAGVDDMISTFVERHIQTAETIKVRLITPGRLGVSVLPQCEALVKSSWGILEVNFEVIKDGGGW